MKLNFALEICTPNDRFIPYDLQDFLIVIKCLHTLT